jgi:hypothetical protein
VGLRQVAGFRSDRRLRGGKIGQLEIGMLGPHRRRNEQLMTLKVYLGGPDVFLADSDGAHSENFSLIAAGAVRSCAATQASKQRVVCPLILD